MKFRASLKSFATNESFNKEAHIQHGVSRPELMRLHTSGPLSILLKTEQVQVS